jgi:hypothetical protein
MVRYKSGDEVVSDGMRIGKNYSREDRLRQPLLILMWRVYDI